MSPAPRSQPGRPSGAPRLPQLSPPQGPESSSLAALSPKRSVTLRLQKPTGNSGTNPSKTKPGLFGLIRLGDAFCPGSLDSQETRPAGALGLRQAEKIAGLLTTRTSQLPVPAWAKLDPSALPCIPGVATCFSILALRRPVPGSHHHDADRSNISPRRASLVPQTIEQMV